MQIWKEIAPSSGYNSSFGAVIRETEVMLRQLGGVGHKRIKVTIEELDDERRGDTEVRDGDTPKES